MDETIRRPAGLGARLGAIRLAHRGLGLPLLGGGGPRHSDRRLWAAGRGAGRPRGAIRGARAIPWSWWRGYGIRWYGWDAAAFVGRGRGVVELTLDPAVEIKAVLRRTVRRLALSPEDPDRLLALLGVPGA